METDMVAKKLIPAAGYIRMSSDKQEASPGQQRDAIIELAIAQDFRTPEEPKSYAAVAGAFSAS